MALGDYIALLEHLPKVGALLNRLLPLLEGRGNAQTTAASEELRASINALHADVSKATTQQASLYRQLNEQGEQLNTLLAEARDAKATIGSQAERLDALQKQLTLARILLVLTTIFSLITMVILIVRKP
jgi:ABC-type transporter Mla subunit MlaD